MWTVIFRRAAREASFWRSGVRIVSVPLFHWTNDREIIMKHNSILKNSAIRSVVLLAGIVMYTVANVSHAQTGATGHDIAPVPGQDGSVTGQPSPRQQGTTPSAGGSPPKNGNAASGQGTSDQTDASPVPPSAKQESGPGGHSTPKQESFLRKIIRIFSGPDSSSGPNRDVDTNISAGGAAGG